MLAGRTTSGRASWHAARPTLPQELRPDVRGCRVGPLTKPGQCRGQAQRERCGQRPRREPGREVGRRETDAGQPSVRAAGAAAATSAPVLVCVMSRNYSGIGVPSSRKSRLPRPRQRGSSLTQSARTCALRWMVGLLKDGHRSRHPGPTWRHQTAEEAQLAISLATTLATIFSNGGVRRVQRGRLGSVGKGRLRVLTAWPSARKGSPRDRHLLQSPGWCRASGP
jgi:hypothetical protein